MTSGLRALDVGCRPGGLTRELVARLGADAVAAVDPSPPFAGAYVARLDADRREVLRAACHAALGEPDGPFELAARAWFARGRVA